MRGVNHLIYIQNLVDKGYQYLGTNPSKNILTSDEELYSGRCLKTCVNHKEKKYWDEDSSD